MFLKWWVRTSHIIAHSCSISIRGEMIVVKVCIQYLLVIWAQGNKMVTISCVYTHCPISRLNVMSPMAGACFTGSFMATLLKYAMTSHLIAKLDRAKTHGRTKQFCKCGRVLKVYKWIQMCTAHFINITYVKVYLHGKQTSLHVSKRSYLQQIWHSILQVPAGDKKAVSSLWGKLASEILMQNWDAALEDLQRLQEVIDASVSMPILSFAQTSVVKSH